MDKRARVLTVREAVYDGTFGTPKPEAGCRQVPLSVAALQLVGGVEGPSAHGGCGGLGVCDAARAHRCHPTTCYAGAFFRPATRSDFPHATWLTFRRTYSSWSHDKGVPGKIVAQLLGHANVDTTLNVYTQVLNDSVRAAVETVGQELFTIVQVPGETVSLTH